MCLIIGDRLRPMLYKELADKIADKVKNIDKEYFYLTPLLLAALCVYALLSNISYKGFFGDELSQSLSALQMLKTGKFYNIYFIYGDSGKFIYLLLDMPMYIYGVLKGYFNAMTYMDPAYFVYYGRLLNSALSTFSGLLIYLIGKSIWDKKTGFLAAIFLLSNSWYASSASWTKTDAISLFFLLLACYILIRYLDTGKGLLAGSFLAGYAVSLKLTTFPILTLPIMVYIFDQNSKANILERLFNIRVFYIIVSILAGIFILAPNTYMLFSKYVYNTTSFFFGVQYAPPENANLFLMCKSVVTAIQSLTGKYMFWIAMVGIGAGLLRKKAVFVSILAIQYFILYFKTPYGGAVIKPHTFLPVYVLLCLFGAVPVVYIFNRFVQNKHFNKMSILVVGMFLVYPTGIKPLSRNTLDAFRVSFISQKTDLTGLNTVVKNGSFEDSASVGTDWHVSGEYALETKVVSDGKYALRLSGGKSEISQTLSGSSIYGKHVISFDMYPVVYSELVKSQLFVSLRAFDKAGNMMHENIYTIARTGNFNWRELDIDWSDKYVHNKWNAVIIPFKRNFSQDGLSISKIDHVAVTIGIKSLNQGLECVIDNFRVN